MQKILMTILLVLSIPSCNKVQKIQQNSNEIQSLAQASKDNYEGIIVAAQSDPPAISEIIERSNQGISQQTQIIEKAKDTIIQTSQVVDAVPKWMEMLELGLWVALAFAILGVSWYLGLGTLTRRLFGYIPQAKQDEAKLLREALDSESETELREVIAYLRARDPELNAAYKKARSNGKTQHQ